MPPASRWAEVAAMPPPRRASYNGTLVHEGDGANRGAIAALELEGQRDEATAGRADPVEVHEVLDHGDADGEEDVVCGAVVPRHFAVGLEDHGADRVVGRVVVPDGLDLPLH